MKIKIKKIKEFDQILFQNLAILHRNEMENSIAKIISIDDLIKIYNILIKNKKIEFYYIQHSANVLGGLILENKIKLNLISYMTLLKILLKYFLLKPKLIIKSITTSSSFRKFTYEWKILAIFIEKLTV